jgi:endonuclease-3
MFDIDVGMARIAEAVAGLPKAAMFELAEDGYDGVFQQLVACIISIRTRDEVSLPTARRLFERAPTAAAIADLSEAEVDELISTSSFHEAKAVQILDIARATVEDHGGELPCDDEALTGFRGVGPKCANLTLGIACGQPRISVDIHVHRVTNRWGYVEGNTPERTLAALEQKLPERHRVDINRLLVPFGKHICTGRRPRCSTCPVLDMCAQMGVENPR